MAFLADWVRNLAYYMIFMTVIVSLLPARSYEKYIRFFAGIILIVLVVQPFLGGFHLEDELTQFYQEFSFKQDTAELERKISGMEERQRRTVMKQYERAVGEDLRRMAADLGLETVSVEVAVGTDANEADFGGTTDIWMKVRYVGEKFEDDAGNESRWMASLQAKNRLKEQIAQYYRMEDSHVEVQLEEG